MVDAIRALGAETGQHLTLHEMSRERNCRKRATCFFDFESATTLLRKMRRAKWPVASKTCLPSVWILWTNVVELWPPRGGYNLGGLCKVTDGAREE
jgi:hypothetical protein